MLNEARDIVCHMLKTERATRESCASVPIEIDSNNLMSECKCGRNSIERLKSSKATVKQNQRSTCSMHLVVQVDAID